MQEFMATSERRAELYGWFATLFAAPLEDEQIAEYDSYDGRSFLKSLATLDPMRGAVAELNGAIAPLLLEPTRQQMLAHHFATLFLNGDPVSAPPQESAYREQAASLMQQRLDRLALPMLAEVSLGSDHLASQLALMNQLILCAVQTDEVASRQIWLTEQTALLNEHLLRWIEPFERRCHEHDHSGFYRSCAALLKVFLQMDDNYLTLCQAE